MPRHSAFGHAERGGGLGVGEPLSDNEQRDRAPGFGQRAERARKPRPLFRRAAAACFERPQFGKFPFVARAGGAAPPRAALTATRQSQAVNGAGSPRAFSPRHEAMLRASPMHISCAASSASCGLPSMRAAMR